MSIQVDSRKIKKGDTFVAIKGLTIDGHDFIEKAIENGASKIIAEKGEYNVETVIVEDTRKYLAEYLKNKYNDKLSKIKFIGLTGTNGKTTSCYLIYQALNKLGKKTAYIGTIGFYVDGKVKDLDNTTPDLLDLYKMFDYCIEKNVEVIAMEVSSHALELGRVMGIEFDYACFTNLTQDHLDFHKTLKKYQKAKLKLFKSLKSDGVAILNGDDPYYKDFYLTENDNIIYGMNETFDYNITNYKLSIDSLEFAFIFDNQKYNVKLNIPGKYNIYNYMNVLIILHKMGYSFEEIIEISLNLKAPSGRFETIKYNNSIIIVDYAHTPDAVENIIDNVTEYKEGKIITIIGCGGDRDRTKRPIMGSISTQKSDFVIFTNDNPRTEDEKIIMADITSSLDKDNYIIKYDRKEAIEEGIKMLKDKDILLLLGKGHEDYQVIGNEKIHFSDLEITKELVNKYSKNDSNGDNMSKKKLKLKKIEIFRTLIMTLLSAFIIFSTVKLVKKSQEIEQKEEINAEYFLKFIDDNKLDYLDKNNDNIDKMNNLTYNFKLLLTLNNIESTKKEDVEDYLKRVFGNDITIEFSNVTDLSGNLIYTYENDNFVKNSEYSENSSVVSDYVTVDNFEEIENGYELTLTKIFYNTENGNIRNGFFGSYSEAVNSKNNGYNLDNAIFTLELTDNNAENKKILDKYYDENYGSFKNNLTKYTYTFKKENNRYILSKYAIIK